MHFKLIYKAKFTQPPLKLSSYVPSLIAGADVIWGRYLEDNPPVVVAPDEAAHDLELEPGTDGETVEDGGAPRHAALQEARAADVSEFARLDGALQHLHCPLVLLSYHCTDEMEAAMDEQIADAPHHNSFAWEGVFI